MEIQIKRVDRILEILEVQFYRSTPPRLDIRVKGQTGHTGWHSVTLIRREYITPPVDGIYEYDMIGIDTGVGARVLTDQVADHRWDGEDANPNTVKGVRIYGKENSLQSDPTTTKEWADAR